MKIFDNYFRFSIGNYLFAHGGYKSASTAYISICNYNTRENIMNINAGSNGDSIQALLKINGYDLFASAHFYEKIVKVK